MPKGSTVRVLTGLAAVAAIALCAAPAQASTSASSAPPAAVKLGPGTNVIGGTPASGGDWPSITPLVVSGVPSTKDGQFCGGTLVSSRWVLTAAHCLFDDKGGSLTASEIDVAVGALKLSEVTAAQRIRVSQVVVNPGYVNGSYANDLALLRLSRESSQPPMAMIAPGEDGLLTPGRPARVAGWGCDTYPVGEPPDCPPGSLPDNLRQATIPVLADSECAGTFGDAFNAAQMICAGTGTPNTCQGDSGGPLTITGAAGTAVLAGVLSFGDRQCASELDRGVYARIASFRSWISSTMATPDPNPNPNPTPTPTPTPAPTPPSKPSAKVTVRKKTVTASVSAKTGVSYSIAAAQGKKTVRGKCRANRKTRKVDCSVKLAKGKWSISVTPTAGGVAGTPLTKSVRVR